MSDQSSHCPRPGLAAARETLGLTQERAAEAIGVSGTTWSRWEQGRQNVRGHSRNAMLKLFGVSAEQLEHWLKGEAGRPLLPWAELGADVAQACSDLWRWDVDPARRRLLATLPFAPAALGELLLSWQLDPGPATREQLGAGRSVGMSDVRRVEEATRSFDLMDRQYGGGLVRPAVTSFLDTQVTPMLRGRYTDDVGAGLMTAASLLTALAGWEAYDVGKHGLAQQHYSQALKLAKAADDQLTAARILSILAQQAIDLNEPNWAVRIAAAGRQASERAHATPRVKAMLALREANATAARTASTDSGHTGVTQRVGLLIGEAEEHFARRSDGDHDPSWIGYFTPAEFTAQAGYCWLLVRDHAKAAAHAQRAVRELGDTYSRAVQFNRVHVATAQLGLGELDAAIASASAAVPMTKTLTSRRSIDMLTDFDHKLDPHVRERRVREWRDYLRAELAPAA